MTQETRDNFSDELDLNKYVLNTGIQSFNINNNKSAFYFI